MLRSDKTRHTPLAMSVGSWYVRRLIRQRGAAAVAGFVAGEGLSFARRPPKRHLLRLALVIGLATAGGLYVVRRRQGGGDDGGDWKPVVPDVPVAPMPAEPAPDPADIVTA
ncbi:MAG: hypothetical protein WCJ67_04880 [Thermoleophilia bacterium]